MAAPNGDYQIDSLYLAGGKLFATYQRQELLNGILQPIQYSARICDVLSPEPYAVITATVNISRPFHYARLIDDKFFVVESTRTGEKDQIEGKQYGQDLWLPLLLNKDEDKLLYVRIPGTEPEMVKLVILDTDPPYTFKKKLLVGLGVGLGAVGVGALSVFAAPLAVAGLGFGTVGITAGSTAATMMSYGMIGVATLQSIGAAGMGVASIIIVGGAGTAAGAAAGAAAMNAAMPVEIFNVDGETIKVVYLIHNRNLETMPPVDQILALNDAPRPDGPGIDE